MNLQNGADKAVNGADISRLSSLTGAAGGLTGRLTRDRTSWFRLIYWCSIINWSFPTKKLRLDMGQQKIRSRSGLYTGCHITSMWIIGKSQRSDVPSKDMTQLQVLWMCTMARRTTWWINHVGTGFSFKCTATMRPALLQRASAFPQSAITVAAIDCGIDSSSDATVKQLTCK